MTGWQRWALAPLVALAMIYAYTAHSQTPSTILADQVAPSAAMRGGLGHVVYLPPGYREGEALPTLYLLHGTFSRGLDWIDKARARETLDRLIAERRIRPMLVVMPDAGNSWYVDSAALGGPGDYERAILRDLIAHIDQRWRTDARRERRAITGISMGGYGALRFAFARPDLFGAAAATSGAFWTRFDQTRVPADRLLSIFQRSFGAPFDRPRFVALGPVGMASRQAMPNPPALFFIAGREDQFRALDEARDVAQSLRALGLESEMDDVAGDHEWGTWERSLPAVLLFVERVFARTSGP
jgi:enterochelin esterase family protein